MNFIDHLKTEVFCRLKASMIHGVGVFAIKPIPKSIDPMSEPNPVELGEIPVRQIKDDVDIPETIKKLVVDMCPEEGGIYAVPAQGLNSIGIAWYLNHSETPNMEERDGFFFSLRDIAEGEELTVNYGTYGNLNL